MKIADPQDSDIVRKTTNKWLRTGATWGFNVYGLRILVDGSVDTFVGNDDPTTPGAPWRDAYSPANLVTPWHHLALRWDGDTVAVDEVSNVV